MLQCRVKYHSHKSSVGGYVSTIAYDGECHEAIALLLPPSYLDLVHRHTDRASNMLDFPAFIRNVYKDSGALEHFVELGCNTASLSMELVMQWQIEQFGVRMPGTFD